MFFSTNKKFIFFTFFGIFLFVQKSSAIIQQPISDTLSGHYTGAEMVSKKQYFINDPESSPTTTIDLVTLKIKSDNGCKYKLKAFDGTTTFTSDEFQTVADTVTDVNFVFSGTKTHTGALDYWYLDGGTIGDGCFGSTANYSGYFEGSATTSSYPNGYWDNGISLLRNQYFLINATSTATSIWFSTTPTTTNDFKYWTMQAYNNTGVDHTNDWQIVVRYGLSDTVMSWLSPSTNTGIDNQNDPNTLYLATKKAPLVSGVVLYAQVLLYNTTDPDSWSDDHLMASSSVWEFIMTTGPQVEYMGQGVTTTAYEYLGSLVSAGSVTSTGNIYTCDPNDSLFEKSLCKMFVYLFVPSPSVWQRFSDLKDDISAKPPFGYVAIYSASINNLQNATSTTSTVGITVLSGFSIFDNIKTIMSWFLYIVFAFWVFNRLRHFSLHG